MRKVSKESLKKTVASKKKTRTVKNGNGVSKLTNINGGTIVVDDDYRKGWNRIFNKNKGDSND